MFYVILCFLVGCQILRFVLIKINVGHQIPDVYTLNKILSVFGMGYPNLILGYFLLRNTKDIYINHTTFGLNDLHWLSVKLRAQFMIVLIVHKCP